MCAVEYPRIISVGFAYPDFSYTQREIFDEFAYPEKFWRLFRDSGISRRSLVRPPHELMDLSLQQQQEVYREEAFLLSVQAINNCMDGRSFDGVGAISFSSCTGILLGPVMGHLLADHFGLGPNTYIMNNLFQGCDGGFPGLRRAIDFTANDGRLTLVIACELSSCAYHPGAFLDGGRPNPKNHYEALRSHVLFADAASCVLVGDDQDARHPRVMDTETWLDTRFLDDLGYRWTDGQMECALSRRVPGAAACLANNAVRQLLNGYQLEPNDIEHWIIHPAGSIVLDMIRDKLGLDEHKLRYSRKALNYYGNCSSATVGIIAKLLMEDQLDPEGPMVMVNIGPGMTGDATLMWFG